MSKEDLKSPEKQTPAVNDAWQASAPYDPMRAMRSTHNLTNATFYGQAARTAVERKRADKPIEP